MNKFTEHRLLVLFLALFITSSVVFSSCGKERTTEPQTVRTDSTLQTEKHNDSEALSNDFIIEYDLEGLIKGKMIIYRSGDKLKQNIKSEILGNKNTNTVYITDKTVYSVIDAGGKKFGTKTDLESYNHIKQTGETITDFNAFGKFLEDNTITGTEGILGYKCNIYDISGKINLSVYNKRYILRIKTPEFIATATVLNTHPVFSKNEFDIPPDVDFNKTGAKGIDSGALDSIVKKIRK